MPVTPPRLSPATALAEIARRQRNAANRAPSTYGRQAPTLLTAEALAKPVAWVCHPPRGPDLSQSDFFAGFLGFATWPTTTTLGLLAEDPVFTPPFFTIARCTRLPRLGAPDGLIFFDIAFLLRFDSSTFHIIQSLGNFNR